MNLNLYSALSDGYKNNSQKIRVLTENWVNENIYCPKCGDNVSEYKNNKPVADFFCLKCSEDYELKSKKGNSLGKIVADGAYDTMIERITSDSSPNFFFLNYEKDTHKIINFVATPGYMFVPEMIIKRKKGIPNRPNYFMCNIDISSIPNSGKISYIENGEIQSKDKVLEEWNKTNFLRQSSDIQSKSWIIDIIMCIEKINENSFTLNDMYKFEKYLKIRHPKNNNIQAKIRQQLQLLRDRDYLEFVSRGKYRLK
ncbi:restriction endonuclease [Sulfurimonas lithotrophica]|uniref:Restriction endonuclease n=1 Tax=Sulfurimonas lithotrophica TaxID=2590022 RepID=A0A5P8P3N8_9BACT|nr:DpnI domain-containing protein [Sulfurimonas lithotrophica]QFR50217.1 restriction endonuclease [Sulfurimonas lithotrophica]